MASLTGLWTVLFFLYKCCQKVLGKGKIRLTIPFLCIIIDWSVYNGG